MGRPPASSSGAGGSSSAPATGGTSTGSSGRCRQKKIKYIESPSIRKITFKKRKKGLLKKLSELSILCAVKACAVIYGPCDPPIDVWPDMQQATEALVEFRSLPTMQQTRNMLTQDEFLRDWWKKKKDQILKFERDITDVEAGHIVAQHLSGMTMLDLMSPGDIGRFKRRIEQDVFQLNERSKKLDMEEAAERAAGGGDGGGEGGEAAAPSNQPPQLDEATINSMRNQADFMGNDDNWF